MAATASQAAASPSSLLNVTPRLQQQTPQQQQPPPAFSQSRDSIGAPLSQWPNDVKRPRLRIAICTENFLPKVDGVTRTLARLLEHLHNEGHEALVLGPDTGMTHYAGHAVVGTFGVPLIIYPGLKLNFMRPRFIRRLQQFKPDVIHFVDPIFLGAQMLPFVCKYLPEVPCVASYHTNLPTYATLFGLPWLESTMWKLTRNLHDRCEMTFCPSESTRRMLHGKGFRNVEIWSRGVDTEIFNSDARDENLRASWGCTPKPDHLQVPLTPSVVAKVKQTANEDASFLRTPPLLNLARKRASIAGSAAGSSSPSLEMSPPPAYDSLAGIPELPAGSNLSFALPPPAMGSSELDDKLVSVAQALSAAGPQHQQQISGNGSGSQAHIVEAADSRTVILYVGRISWEKNLRLLIEAFRHLPATVRSRAKLVFVGDGPARADLTKLCAKLGLDASFMGHQKGKRLAAMYASSSVFAFPSFTETFGQVVLEALASGLPVVGLHAEGTSDLVCHGKTGLLLDVNAVLNRTSNSTPASPASLGGAASPPLNRTSSAPQQQQNGLATPIPTVLEFAHAMSYGTPAFTQCAQSYSMLLERLILNRPARATMGQRAQAFAQRKTWWDAMDAVVVGYETVLRRRSEAGGVLSLEQKQKAREEEDELKARAVATVSRKRAALTGPVTKLAICLYLTFFVALLARYW